MTGFFTPGGDKTTKNELRNPLKGRYAHAADSYRAEQGPQGATVVTKASAPTATSRQIVKSYGHPWRLLGRNERGWNIGGEFLNIRVDVTGGRDYSVDRTYGGNPNYVTNWAGKLYANPQTATILSAAKRTPPYEEAYLRTIVSVPSVLDMYRDGATAIARTAPTNPLVDLSTSLAELYREGLPSSPGSSGNVGGEYLNVQFGILPLASDIREMRSVAAKADELLAQYARNSGRWIRRRYEFDPSVSSSTTTQNYAMPQHTSSVPDSYPSGSHFQPGKLTVDTDTQTKTWFSGAFTYYLPKEGIGRSLAELDYLYGIVPGLDTAYQLTPWSWLVDYFSNVGDVVSNINAVLTEGLVIPYGYVMSETTTRIQSRLDFKVWDGVWSDTTVFDTIRAKAQRRLPANPFGFGISDDGLTSKQLSILAALGLSRR